MSDIHFQDLKGAVESGSAVAIVGAGVSIAATCGEACASWTGLLHHGAEYCKNYVPNLPLGWSERVHDEINSGDLDDLLSAAEKLSRKLGASVGGEYARWLQDSVGKLQLKDDRLIKALGALGVPLITTNYDNLISKVLGIESCTWMDRAVCERVIHGDKDAIIHLHGHWERPESVILGIRSYEEIRGDIHAQSLLRASRTLRTLIFVGCGEGLNDPNFGAMSAWARTTFSSSPYRHYRLACTRDINDQNALQELGTRIVAVHYGENHEALPEFLVKLAPDPVTKPLPNSSRQNRTRDGSRSPVAFIRNYRTRLSARYDRWDIRYTGAIQSGGSARPIEPGLEEMYVPLRLHAGYDIAKLDVGETVCPEDLISREKPLVLRGPAGVGKTTWMRFTFRGLLQNEKTLPIMVELRRLVREWTQEGVGPGSRSLDDYITRSIQDGMGSCFDARALWLAIADKTGPRPILLVDGWDETGEFGADLRSKLIGFIRNHPHVLVVVTSRPYGQDRPSDSDGFEILDIQPLSDGEIGQLASNFFRRCYREDRVPYEESLVEFLAALEQAEDTLLLGRTVLFLIMMLLISRSSPLPDRRHKLYEKCIESLLSAIPDRAESDGVQLNRHQWRPDNSDARFRAVAGLAGYMNSHDYFRNFDHRGHMVTTRENAEAGLPQEWNDREKRGFIAWLSERAGLLTDRSDGTVTFSHLSFHEYLTAWHLNANTEGDQERVQAFMTKREDTRWWETLRLWAALIESRNTTRLEFVLSELMEDESGFWLVGSILADGTGSDPLFQIWLHQLIDTLSFRWCWQADACARAWSSSRQIKRRNVMEHAIVAVATSANWLARYRFGFFLDQALSITLPYPHSESSALTMEQCIANAPLSERAVAMGRVLCGGPPFWPIGSELALLQLWPGRRRLAGLRIQSLANLAAPSTALVSAMTTLPNRLTGPSDAKEYASFIARNFTAKHAPSKLYRRMIYLFVYEIALEFRNKFEFPERFASDFENYLKLYLSRDFLLDSASQNVVDFTRDLAHYLPSGSAQYSPTHNRIFIARFTQEFAQKYSSSAIHRLIPERPELYDSSWIADFALAEGFSFGRVAAPVVLAFSSAPPNLLPANVLSTACRMHYRRTEKTQELIEILSKCSVDFDPLWPALARHIAGHRGSLAKFRDEDSALLEDLAKHPEKREGPLGWGLRYIVRGDIMLEDGTVVTLDELARNVDIEAPPHLEPMSEAPDLNWDEK